MPTIRKAIHRIQRNVRGDRGVPRNIVKMDKDRIARRMGAAAIIVVLLPVALSQWNAVGAMGNRRSPTPDQWTEADTLRAGEGYARYGYLENAGLLDLAYGYQFPDIGTKKLLSGGLDGYQAWVQGTITQRPSGETL